MYEVVGQAFHLTIKEETIQKLQNRKSPRADKSKKNFLNIERIAKSAQKILAKQTVLDSCNTTIKISLFQKWMKSIRKL